jgi:chemotaxis protein CheZ
MDVCDEMTVIAGNCSPEINQKLIDCTTKIFEACNFQDIIPTALITDLR